MFALVWPVSMVTPLLAWLYKIKNPDILVKRGYYWKLLMYIWGYLNEALPIESKSMTLERSFKVKLLVYIPKIHLYN